jgi:hypothetical protein
MSNRDGRPFIPPITAILSVLLPSIVFAWYLLEKSPLLWIRLVGLGALIVILVALYFLGRWRVTAGQSFWYRMYDLMTGEGREPFRLFVIALMVVLIIAGLFEFGGLQSADGLHRDFILRYVEVDLYWTLLSFIGISDPEIMPIGFGKFLTLATAISGYLFLGLYISLLSYKHLLLKGSNHGGNDVERPHKSTRSRR